MRKLLIGLIVVMLIGFIIPENRHIPVLNATAKDWNHNTFWYEPWGSSGVHKGVDIFAEQGAAVIASTPQVILYQGQLSKGGNVILALGPKWRLHYYAHLDAIEPNLNRLILGGETIAQVGDSGNAKGKTPHLHYSIVSLVPMFWKIDTSTQGYKKAFYLNPHYYFTN